MTSFQKVEGYQTNDGTLHTTIKGAVEHQIKDVLNSAAKELYHDGMISQVEVNTFASILVTSPYNHQIANLLKELN